MAILKQQLQQHRYQMTEIHGNLQALFNAIPIPTFAWQSVDNDFILIDYNDAANKIRQSQSSATLGAKVTEFYYDRPDIIENMRCCFATHRVIEEEISIALRTTGEEKRFATKYCFFPPDMILLYTEDITPRKVAEEKIIASEIELRALFGAMSDVVLVLDRHGRYIKIAPTNPAFMYRLANELVGKTLDEVFPHSQATSFLTQIQNVLRTRQPDKINYSLLIGNRVIWFEATISPLSEEQVFCIARDVTERKAMVEQLQINLRRLSVIFDIYRQTTQGFDMEALIAETLIILQKHLEVDAIAFSIRAEDGQKILLMSSIGLPEKLVSSLKKRGLGEGIDNRAIRTGIPQNQKLKDTPDSEIKRNAERYGFTDIASYPLMADGKGIAAIAIVNKNDHIIREKDREILMVTCGLLGTMLHNIQLFGSLKQELEERKQADEISRQREECYRLLADNIEDVIFTVDLSNRPTYYSPSVIRLLGYTPEELMSLPIEKQFTSCSVAMIAQAIRKVHVNMEAGQQVEKGKLELEQIRKDGSVVWVEVVCSGMYTPSGTLLGILGVIREISERKLAEVALKENEKKLRYIAFHHPLTGLPNRVLFTRILKEQYLLIGMKQACGILLLVGINDFKLVNGSFGHSCGDAALIQIAQRLLTLMGAEYTVAHIGADEFAILLPGLRNQATGVEFINRIMQLFEESFVVGDARFYLSASIGSVVYPEQCGNVDELLKNAYIALHEVPISGKGGYCFFDTLLQEAVQESMRVANDLRQAVWKSEFILYYQPKVELLNGKIAGFEALIRWQHPTAGLISPDRFIPMAERTGLILPIGKWVLQMACQFIQRLREDGYKDLSIAVNISSHQLMQQDFVEEIIGIMTDAGVPAECLELEITESVLLENLDKYIGKLEQLRALGIKIALDDFGTGYSSLSYLKSLPVNTLKIDKQFIDDVTDDVASGAIVGALIQMAHALGLTVVAEGVETFAQQQFLQGKQCDQIQGYLFSKPILEEETRLILRKTL